MITDSVPKRKARKEEYLLSDSMNSLYLPPPDLLNEQARALEEALLSDNRAEIESICNCIAEIVAQTFAVDSPPVKVLGVRPHRTSDGVCVYEKFGDYDFETSLIRLWMRTAIRQKVTSYGTLLSTLCHELCHHLDVVKLGLPNTFHTRGFYTRAALLYHHTRDTPVRPIVWAEQSDGTYRVNWAQTMSKRTVPLGAK